MQSYHHFTQEEREIIMLERTVGKSIRSIAKQLGRNHSSVSREIARNTSSRGKYSPYTAWCNYRHRRKRCVRKRSLMANTPFKAYMIAKLDEKWSPEVSLNRYRLEHPDVKLPCLATLYRAFRNGTLDPTLKQKLRRKGRNPRLAKNDRKNGKLQVDLTIAQRPAVAGDRLRIGDIESDSMLGAKGTGGMATHVDRRSRFLVAAKLSDQRAETFTNATVDAFRNSPLKPLTMTADRGMEFALFRDLQSQLHIQVFFCEPHSPWQRPTNENTNGLLRAYFPKSFDFSKVSSADIQAAVDSLNNRPRKCLHWLSPCEVLASSLVHFN